MGTAAVPETRRSGQAGFSIDERDIDHYGQEIVIRVSGNGFLYNMVRIIAGTLMEVGRGHIAPQEIERILEAKDRQAACLRADTGKDRVYAGRWRQYGKERRGYGPMKGLREKS